MKFQHYRWGQLSKGSVVVVTLSTGANVRLMNSSNFNSYQSGRSHRYYGGLARKSPFRIVVPSTGEWHLTVDLAGLAAQNVRMGVSVEPPALPPAQSNLTAPLAGVAHEPPPAGDTKDQEFWDVFVSHASEDKEAVAGPLAAALVERGLRVWLDSTELRIGDSLRRKIDYGLSHSSFGVVVMSKSFFNKGWTQYELDGIVGQLVAGQQRMLPIWHEISKDEILAKSPSLADKIARSTSTYTISEIAQEIYDVVRSLPMPGPEHA